MNVLYYVPAISQEAGGVRQYACALLELLAQHTKYTYYVLNNVSDPVIGDIVARHERLRLIPVSTGQEGTRDKAVTYATRLMQFVGKKFGQNVRVKGVVDRLCTTYRIDLVYCPYQYLPATSRPTVATLHDTQELHFPEFFTPAQRVNLAMLYKEITEQANVVVVSYEHVRQDLIKYFNRSPESIVVCLLNMTNLWFRKYEQAGLPAEKPPQLPDSYLLYPAVTWPHKNHENLLRALAQLNQQHGEVIPLVCTGHTTSHFAHLQRLMQELNLTNQVTFAGILAEPELYRTYRNARAVVVPTLYEAGSFPLMESILMRIPVICSTVTSLPETIGSAEFTFDPKNVADIADKIWLIWQDEAYRSRNVVNSEWQADRLIHTGAEERIQDVLRKALA